MQAAQNTTYATEMVGFGWNDCPGLTKSLPPAETLPASHELLTRGGHIGSRQLLQYQLLSRGIRLVGEALAGRRSILARFPDFTV
jgi:hypothetical protein